MVEASCHCGPVRLPVAEPPARVTDCNCSICRRLGASWACCPAEQLRISATPGSAVAYVQGDGTPAIRRCRTCGGATRWIGLGESAGRAAINARLLDPGVLARAKVRRFDGADSFTYPDEA